MTPHEQLQADIQIILNCFTGADGGVDFVLFKTFMEGCAKDESGLALLDIVHKFAKLITSTVQISRERFTNEPNTNHD